jgi:YhfC intramembrane metalloprotease
MTPTMAGALVSALGMVLVAAATVVMARRLYRPACRWFWVGAALWAVAVVPKLVLGALSTVPMLKGLHSVLPFNVYVVVGGLCMGLFSAMFEIGVTIAAGLIWRRPLGGDLSRAVAIGAGAGAFEAALLGLAAGAGALAAAAGVPGTEEAGEQIRAFAESTPLFWLVSPMERITAVLSHTASRALVLLGIARGRWWMVVAGFAIFTLLDGLAGVVQVSDAVHRMSIWWIELSLAPAGLLSFTVLVWLHRRPRQPSDR